MNFRNINPSYVGILFLMISILLNGCSTIGTTSKKTEGAVSPASDEEPKEVKLNEFILGPGDKIEVLVYRNDDLQRTVQIDTSGKITYPLLGDIQAGGISIFQLRDKIKDGLSKYIINPQVSVGVVSVQSQKVIVLGEVKNPGLFILDTPLSTVEAVSRAGGFTIHAKQKNVLLIRGGLKKPELIVLNMEGFFSKQDLAQNVYLKNGDIIYVPETFIENVARFFDHLARIISPIVSGESGYYIGRQIVEGTSAVSVPTR